MRVRQIMDCSFPLCTIRDSIGYVAEQMIQHNSSLIVAVDEKNQYRGIITATSLLGMIQSSTQTAAALLEEVHPIFDTDDVSQLKKVNHDAVPVINTNYNVVGVVSLKSLIEYLPEALATNDAGHVRKTGPLSSKYTIDDIIGQSRDMLVLKERIIAAAKTRSTVLIMGETGTGKELVAHAIHRLSDRRHQPFIRVNCAAIPDTLLESELFGYEQGAFTGAAKGGHPGKFQLADGGAIFLDEIGDMPLMLQSKILRVLQEKEIEKIGGRFPVPVDVRVIAATHRNLLDLVKEGKFRQDLFFRLHVIPIQVPALRNHRDDIPLLADYFLQRISREMINDKPAVDRSFVKALLDYSWPGNVRELANIIEMAVSFSGSSLTVECLPDYMQHLQAEQHPEEDNTDLRSHADEAERSAILKAMEMYRGNKNRVAEALGISRSSLYNKMRKYAIEG